jgi:chromosome transmission fidelity protein 8
MPSVPLYPQPALGLRDQSSTSNPLPELLQTPSGLAILELQGTINVPAPTEEDLSRGGNDDDMVEEGSGTAAATFETEIGKLMFPDYSPLNPDDTKWMKRVYLYAGQYQRMTGEVKKLAKPLAVIRRRQKPSGTLDGDQLLGEKQGAAGQGQGQGQGQDGDELEIVEIIKYKILFPSRPEPVGLEG